MNGNYLKSKGAIISTGIIRGDSETVVNGNLTINNHGNGRLVIIAVAIVSVIAMLLLATVTVILITNIRPQERPPGTPLKVGPRGGVYWVDKNGSRHYVDRANRTRK